MPRDTSNHIECFRAEGGVIVTPDMLDAWTDAAERGDYPGLGGDAVVYFGCIPPTDDELEADCCSLIKDRRSPRRLADPSQPTAA